MVVSLMMAFFILLSLVIPMVGNVLLLGGLLLMTSFFMTVFMVKFVNSWFGFILFLVYISGLLVLFGYMLAMSANTFKSVKSSGYSILAVVGGAFTFLGVYTYGFPVISGFFEWTVVGMYGNMNLLFYWFMVSVLLIVLVMVVSLCYKTPSPLRPFL